MDKLRPCPFCGSEETKVRTLYLGGHPNHTRYCVDCEECGASGGIDLGTSGAIEQWNMRSDQLTKELCLSLVDLLIEYATELPTEVINKLVVVGQQIEDN